ncbi:unnamed protein product [Rotaria sordida]|uniref:cyclin-dependent kinase n=1 Tax=Rotaria sordida TaxID=392033 RepID=A0A818PD58_9BILA|nr:unnamed protein product [Rotaria sordida]
MNKTPDLNTRKRILFFQKINPKTTKQSLQKFLSEFQIEKCSVPVDQEGKNDNVGHNKHHAIVTFIDESSITILMSRRPLIIDDQEVFIHRYDPDQISAKDNTDIKTLTVSSTIGRSLTKYNLERYFRKYGEIDHIDCINDDDNTYIIHFKDYDSVDRTLLNEPHEINNISVNIKKGHQHSFNGSSDSNESLTTANNNNQTTTPRKSILKVNFDSQISSLCLPEPKYCIHIKDLPTDVDAERLSVGFNWSIYDILMGPTLDDQSSSMECWLKSPDNQAQIDEFIQNSKQRKINGSIIQCEKEEDQLELCKFFRTGQCEKSDDNCHWAHVKCTANGTCSRDCPYGHVKGLKMENLITNNAITTYRIKISGFGKKLTRISLAQWLHQNEKYCYVDERQNQVGYIINLITLKYAKQLMKKWHNSNIGGSKLKCQLEINQKSSMHRALSRSLQSLNNGETDNDACGRRNSRSSNNYSAQSSRDSSISRADDHSPITVLNDQHINSEGRLYAHAFNTMGKSWKNHDMRPASSIESIPLPSNLKPSLPNDVSSDEWEVIKQASGNGRKALFIVKKSDRKYNAVIKVYQNELQEACYRELSVLKMLKGVQGVAQLIEPEHQSNNFKQKANSKADLWIIMQRAWKHSLQTVIDRNRERNIDDIEVSIAIQFIQNLIGIVKRVHSQGILHQNLEPENIMIECESTNPSIGQARLTLLNFTQAYIKSDQSASMNQEKAYQWYQPPQAHVQAFKYSATNDASVIVAILLWLLTGTIPQHDTNVLPHQQLEVHEKISQKISRAIQSANANRSVKLEFDQLKTYLIDTFNRAFGFPEYEPWTIDDLECRIKSIWELLISDDSKLNTIEDIFQNLFRLTTSSQLIGTSAYHPTAIQKAADAFSQVKQEFLKSHANQYMWFDGNCTWLNSAQHSMNEYRHDDILTYYCRNQNYSIIITCFTSINDEGRIVTLSIGSTVHGKMIRIPLGQYSIAKDYVTQLQEIFNRELKNLLLSIYNEQKEVQQ